MLSAIKLPVGRLSAASHDASHGDARIVVADAARCASEEAERTDVCFLERFGAFTRKDLAEERIAIVGR